MIYDLKQLSRKACQYAICSNKLTKLVGMEYPVQRKNITIIEGNIEY